MRTIYFDIKKRVIELLLLSFLVLLPQIVTAKADENRNGTKIILIISSFNPDTESTHSFIEGFAEGIEKRAPGEYRILVEDLAARNFAEEGWQWKWRITKLLEKHKDRNLRAIVTVGQEAWSALISQESIPKQVPIFSAHNSTNAIELPTAPIDDSWEPVWINGIQKARKLTKAGGVSANYIPYKNIQLVQSFFPDVTDVAITVDNTYGGQAFKAMIRKQISALSKGIKIHFLDASKQYLAQIQDSLAKLPPTSAILVGTWKVNRDGLYFSTSSLENLLSSRKDLPVFTLTGKGLSDVAIGGFIPNYIFNPEEIVSQFYQYEKDSTTKLKVAMVPSNYSFNEVQLKRYSVSSNALPIHSQIINVEDKRIQTYRSYATVAIILTIFLTLLLIIITASLRYQRKLKRNLEVQAKELIDAKEKAEESNRLKSSFIANISHEIRTPLNSIVGFSNIIFDSELSNEEKIEAQKIVSHNSELLLSQISDLLDLSHIESGNLTLNYTQVNLYDLCKMLIYNFDKLNKREVEYKLICEDNNLIIDSDRKRLEQVITILLANATKFTESGQIELEYKISKYSDPQSKILMISVTDTGCGIPRDKQHLLFQTFTKLNNSEQGTGLGLSIAKQLVIRLGGSIWLDPYYTNGAKFIFTHPL